MAYGSIARVCSGLISVVPPLVVAVPRRGIDGATHGLERQHTVQVLCLVFAKVRASVEGSRLDYAAGEGSVVTAAAIVLVSGTIATRNAGRRSAVRGN